MSDHDAGPGCAIFGLLVIGLCLSMFGMYMYGRRNGIEYHQQQAVEQGFAEYIVDQQGQVTWRWKNSE